MKERLRAADDIAGGMIGGFHDIKKLKNQLIGSRRNKTRNLACIPSILQIVSSCVDGEEVRVQAAQAIASFAAATDGASAIIECNGVNKLLTALQQSKNIRLVEATVRALRLIYSKSTHISPDELLTFPGALQTLVSLLTSEKQQSPRIIENAALLLSHCCTTEHAQIAILSSGALPHLIRILLETHDTSHHLSLGSHSRQQAAALSVLVALTSGKSTTASAAVLHSRSAAALQQRLLSFAQFSSTHNRTKFAACVCLSNLSAVLPSVRGGGAAAVDGHGHVLVVHPPQSHNYLLSRESTLSVILPILVRLLTEGGAEKGEQDCEAVAIDVPPVLVKVMKGSAELQAAAVDADVIAALSDLLLHSAQLGTISDRDEERVILCRQHGFLALAMLTKEDEVNRKKVVDSGAFSLIVSALHDDDNIAEKEAACRCIRTLSRSTRLIRYGDISLKKLVAPLLRLSKSENLEAATDAAAALANLAVDFSSCEESGGGGGGGGGLVCEALARFVELTAENAEMRLYGVWGLSSLLYLASLEMKEMVMKALPWSRVASLLHDANNKNKTESGAGGGGDDDDDAVMSTTTSSEAVKEKTLMLLRNLLYFGASTEYCCPVSAVLQWSEGSVLTEMLAAVGGVQLTPPGDVEMGGVDEEEGAFRRQAPATTTTTTTTIANAAAPVGGGSITAIDTTTTTTAATPAAPSAAFPLLEAVVHNSTSSSSSSSKQREHALYAVANIASGHPKEKAAVIASGWPLFIATALGEAEEAVREAAIWVIINLTWPHDEFEDAESVKQWKAELERLGVADRLRSSRETDISLSVRERAATALEQLSHWGDGGGVGGANGALPSLRRRRSGRGGGVGGYVSLMAANDVPRSRSQTEEQEEEELMHHSISPTLYTTMPLFDGGGGGGERARVRRFTYFPSDDDDDN